MSLEGMLDVLGSALILVGASFTLTAAIGLVRLPDVLNRMHAASKPQALGFLLLCAGLALVLREVSVTMMLILAAGLQLTTAPAATQMMGKAAYRTGQFREDIVVVDDHTPDTDEDPEEDPDDRGATG